MNTYLRIKMARLNCVARDKYKDVVALPAGKFKVNLLARILLYAFVLIVSELVDTESLEITDGFFPFH